MSLFHEIALGIKHQMCVLHISTKQIPSIGSSGQPLYSSVARRVRGVAIIKFLLSSSRSPEQTTNFRQEKRIFSTGKKHPGDIRNFQDDKNRHNGRIYARFAFIFNPAERADFWVYIVLQRRRKLTRSFTINSAPASLFPQRTYIRWHIIRNASLVPTRHFSTVSPFQSHTRMHAGLHSKASERNS